MLEFGYIKGDGVGPELIDHMLYILNKFDIKYKAHEININYNSFNLNEVAPHKFIIKGPNKTPYGYKSVNFYLRKYLDLAVNIRPANNIVILRENTQDIYTNEEYGYGDVFFSKKLLTKNVTERFAQFCKTFISNNNYSNATIMCKDNLLSDKYFIDILNKYIKTSVEWQDNGLAKLSQNPEKYQVIITPNIVGDIASNITSLQEGNIAYAASIQVGENNIVFEPVHGTADKHVNKQTLIKTGIERSLSFLLYNTGYKKLALSIYKNAKIKIPSITPLTNPVLQENHIGWDILVFGNVNNINCYKIFHNGIETKPLGKNYYKLRFYEKDLNELLTLCKDVSILNIERLCFKETKALFS